MRILLTNDDGIAAEGLRALRRALGGRADVFTVAPLHEQSGTGHSITLYQPLRAREFREKGKLLGYGVDGTPADCVKIGINMLMRRKPDIVVSGINPGGNIGTNVVYSGTVSAALEAYVMGYTAVAVSIDGFKNLHYDYAARLAFKIVKQLENKKFPKCFLNVNIPNVPAEKIKGIKVTRQGMSRFIESYNKRTDPRQNIYYWLDGELVDVLPDAESDYHALRHNYVSVTPLKFDLTETAHMKLAGEIIRKL